MAKRKDDIPEEIQEDVPEIIPDKVQAIFSQMDHITNVWVDEKGEHYFYPVEGAKLYSKDDLK